MNKDNLVTIVYEEVDFDQSEPRQRTYYKLSVDDQFIGEVRVPAYDGARLLLTLGYSPRTYMTTRSSKSQCASWVPQPIYKFARLTVNEDDSRFRVANHPTHSLQFDQRVAYFGGRKPASGFYEATYPN